MDNKRLLELAGIVESINESRTPEADREMLEYLFKTISNLVDNYNSFSGVTIEHKLHEMHTILKTKLRGGQGKS